MRDDPLGLPGPGPPDLHRPRAPHGERHAPLRHPGGGPSGWRACRCARRRARPTWRPWPRPPTTGEPTASCWPWRPGGRSQPPSGRTVSIWSMTCRTTWPSSSATTSTVARGCCACTARAPPGRCRPATPELPPDLAGVGQPVLVPGSMGTASHVLVGVSGGGAFPLHLSRRRSDHEPYRSPQVRLGAALQRELEGAGIAVRAGSRRGLAEEAPFSYKDVDAVVATVERPASPAGCPARPARRRQRLMLPPPRPRASPAPSGRSRSGPTGSWPGEDSSTRGRSAAPGQG